MEPGRGKEAKHGSSAPRPLCVILLTALGPRPRYADLARPGSRVAGPQAPRATGPSDAPRWRGPGRRGAASGSSETLRTRCHAQERTETYKGTSETGSPSGHLQGHLGRSVGGDWGPEFVGRRTREEGEPWACLVRDGTRRGRPSSEIRGRSKAQGTRLPSGDCLGRNFFRAGTFPTSDRPPSLSSSLGTDPSVCVVDSSLSSPRSEGDWVTRTTVARLSTVVGPDLL